MSKPELTINVGVELKSENGQEMNTFDHFDISYLAKNLSVVQLRHEIHAAENKISVTETWRDTEYQSSEDLFPWDDFAVACREAIKIIQQRQPKPRPINGHIDVEALKQQIDIVAVIESYGIKLRKTGHNFKALCPFRTEKTPSFIVYPQEKRFHCYGCEADGDTISFVMKIEDCDFKTAAIKVGEIR